MKFCEKCGKEIVDEAVICPGCGCATQNESKLEKKEVAYEDLVKGAATKNIISAIVIVVGIVCWLFVNMWVGAILCLVAELVALSTNSKVQNAFKQNGLTGNSKETKEKKKAIVKELKSKNGAYSFSFVLAAVALVLLVFFVLFI